MVDPGTIGDEAGGFITFNSPRNAGEKVTIVSGIPYDRTVDYQNNGDFLPDTVNGDNDRQVSQIKQVLDRSNRTIAFPDSSQNVTGLEYPSGDRGNTFLGFDQNGDPIFVPFIEATDVIVTASEQFTLTDGQTTVNPSLDVRNVSVHVLGNAGADRGKLFVDIDYAIDTTANSILLFNSFPGGTTLTVEVNEPGPSYQAPTGGAIIQYANVASLTAQSLISGVLVETIDYRAGVRGGGATYLIKTAGEAASDGDVIDGFGNHTLANGNVAIIQRDSILSDLQFGVVGDDVTDDNLRLQSLLYFAGEIQLSGKTYRSEDMLNVLENTTLYLNGSTVNFNLTTQVPGFSCQGDNIEIFGGTVNVVGSMMGGSGNSLNCITSGNQATGDGYEKLSFHDLTCSTNRSDAGATIGFLGECRNSEVYNITVPDNALCRNIIGIEWGGTAAGTGHPHNITVDNIRCGKLTFPSSGASGFGFVVWASSAFNIKVSNIFLEQGFGLMMAIAGDNSNEFAPIEYKDAVGKGITLDNAECLSCFGYGLRAVGKGFGSSELVDESVFFRNVYVKADPTATGNVFGFQTEFSEGAKLKGFKFEDCFVGYSTGSDVKRPVVEDGEIIGSSVFGMGLGSSGIKCIEPYVNNVRFIRNNADGGAGTGTAAITCSQVDRPRITNCTFGEDGEVETQRYSISGTIDTVSPYIENNHTYDLVAGGVAYIFGASTQPEINAHGTNNTAASGLTVTSGSPIFTLDTLGHRTFKFSIVPVGGQYNQGDKLYFQTPVAGGSIGAVCVTSGTPGTWKNFGNIDL